MARPRQVSDEALMRAARDAFIEHGPGTTVSQIAERLGVSAAALFQRAGSKAQLMLMALAPGPHPAMEALRQPPTTDRSVVAQLRDHLLSLLHFFASLVPNLITLKAAGLFPPADDAKAPGRGPRVPAPLELRRSLAGWLRVAVDDGRIEVRDTRVCAEALLGAMEARCFNAHVGGARYVTGSDRTFVRTLVAGLVGDLEAKSRPSSRRASKRARSPRK